MLLFKGSSLKSALLLRVRLRIACGNLAVSSLLRRHMLPDESAKGWDNTNSHLQAYAISSIRFTSRNRFICLE